MKIVVLGDIHGRSIWKNIVNQNFDADKIIFIGDYFDSFSIDGPTQLENFADILAFKKANLDKVVLLIGNHCYHYMPFANETYSGFQRGYNYQITGLFEANLKYFQMCKVVNNYLFIHAGLTKTWCEDNNIDMNNIEQSVNELWHYKPQSFKFTPGRHQDPYGDEPCQSPIWVRPASLFQDRIDDYIQVVGHTHQDGVKIYDSVIFIDTFDKTKEYLIIEDAKPVIKHLD